MNQAGAGLGGWKYVSVLARPRLVSQLSPQTGAGVYSEVVELVCQVECFPLCHIGWYRDGTFISNKVKHRSHSFPAQRKRTTGMEGNTIQNPLLG